MALHVSAYETPSTQISHPQQTRRLGVYSWQLRVHLMAGCVRAATGAYVILRTTFSVPSSALSCVPSLW